MPVKTLTPAGNAAKTLTATADPILKGLFPPFFPGATTFPGRGSTISASPQSAKTLTGTAN